jgi:hypothetical protein
LREDDDAVASPLEKLPEGLKRCFGWNCSSISKRRPLLQWPCER